MGTHVHTENNVLRTIESCLAIIINYYLDYSLILVKRKFAYECAHSKNKAHRLIGAFVSYCLDSTIALVSMFESLSIQLAPLL